MGRPMVIAAVAALVAASACAPGSSNDRPKAKAPNSISTDVAKAGPVTLTVWDQEVLGGQNEQMQRLNAAFHQKYPNVTIKRTSRSFTDLQKTLRAALSGGNPPDVVEANQGYAAMGAFARANLLVPLDAYDKVYGWRTRFPTSLIDINSVTPDGRTIGSGRLYGVSINGEIVGIFYNKKKLARLGLRQPATWGDFEQALATAKGKGELPIAFGNLEKLPAVQEFGVIQGQTAGKRAVRSLVFGTGGAWTDPPNVQAAQRLADWVKRGYLTPNANAIKWDDMPADFAKGRGVFMIGGTWFAPTLQQAMGNDVGFMLPPPQQAGGAPVTMGGESLPWAITSKSRHPDVAAAYINFVTSPRAMDVSTEVGLLPALRSGRSPTTPLMKEIFTAWQRINDADGLTPYLDYSTVSFTDTLGGALQKLIAGRSSGQEAMAAAQRDYGPFLKNK